MIPDDTFPAATIETLRRRADLLARLRRFLEFRGYWEVETPLLSHDVCIDAHIEPIAVPIAGKTMYLQTSPEFAMKRLLAADSGSIYQITRSFRGGEIGGLHNPEFTIVEWYRVGSSAEELIEEIADLIGNITVWPRSRSITYREAFRRHAQIDPFEATHQELQSLAASHGFNAQNAERDDLLNFLLATLVEPRLGAEQPEFLCDYPPSQAALARIKNVEPRVAERFELYYQGIELANGFGELCDPSELSARNSEQNAIRVKNGLPALPEDSRLLSAMESGLPTSAGVALGFDRLTMLVLGATDIQSVMAFPFDRA